MKKPDRHRKPQRPHNARQSRCDHHTPPRPTRGAPGYLARLVAAQASGVLVRPGEVTTVTVAHEHGCRRPKGGACTCTPDVTARDERGRVHVIDAAGAVSTERPS